MEGDFRRPPARRDSFSGGRPQPGPSQRPWPVTDLRPEVQQPIPHQPAATPQPVSPTPQPSFSPTQPPVQPVAQPAPVQSVPQMAQSQAPEPSPSTAELIAQHEREAKAKPNGRRNLVLAVAGFLVIITAVFLLGHHSPAKANGPLPASITPSQITIPVYYPKGLPSGFKVSGYKVVQQNVLNYVVTNSNNDNFYVNIQAIPAGYDFTAFNKRFTAPTTYPTPIDTATAGLMNNQLICSIPTTKSWVMINTTATKATTDMETIAKALKPVSL